MVNGAILVAMRAAAAAMAAFLAVPVAPAAAQEPEREADCRACPLSRELPAEPQVFHTQEQSFRVVPLKGLTKPWALAFLPNGDILITEHRGQLRIVRDGVLDPEPLAGLPEIFAIGRRGLMDIVLHPPLRGEPVRLLHLSQVESRTPHGRYACPRPRQVRWARRARGDAATCSSRTPPTPAWDRRRGWRSVRTARSTW